MLSNLIILCLIAASLFGCATKDQGKLRDEDPFTLAVDGILVRPNKTWGLGLQALGIRDDVVGANRDDFPYGKELLRKGAVRNGDEVNYSLVYYPWEKSAFFLGITGGRGEIKLSWYEQAARAGDEPVLVEYIERDIVLGPAIGWTWMFRYGVTFHLNLGPRFQIHKTTRFDAGGDGSGVDEEERDATIVKAGKTFPYRYGPNYRGINFLIGFSF